MEATEEKLINDRDIMDGTAIERQDHSGRIRFKTTLPSGRSLNSEWIQESDKTKAGILWVAAVRGQIVADSEESAARARRVLKEAKEVARSAGPVLLGPDGQPAASSGLSTHAEVLSQFPTPAMSERAPTVAVDPAAYVRSQHTAARQRLDELKAEKERISFEYAQAQKAEVQWFGLLQAMGVNTLGETVGNSGGTAGVSSGDIGSSSLDREDLSEHAAAE